MHVCLADLLPGRDEKVEIVGPLLIELFEHSTRDCNIGLSRTMWPMLLRRCYRQDSDRALRRQSGEIKCI